MATHGEQESFLQMKEGEVIDGENIRNKDMCKQGFFSFAVKTTIVMRLKTGEEEERRAREGIGTSSSGGLTWILGENISARNPAAMIGRHQAQA